MKKILVFLLVLVMVTNFTFYSLSAPPPRVIIRSEDELIELRRMAEAGEEAFTRSGHRELITYGEVVAFLGLLDSLPIPHTAGMQFSSLTYHPGSESQTFDITFVNGAGERQSFRLLAGGDKGRSAFEEVMG
ncbi:MAG: hypothetical protein LBC82_07395 [Oscillospiraceae bacterium]|jgi:hypothetical protein|nr:hypothetical protein [Oscillospiraceae bacterium]